MSRKSRLAALLVALLALGGVCAAGSWWLLQPAGDLPAPPQVVLETSAGAQPVPLGQPVEMRGGAYSPAPQGQIVRLILWIDGRVAGEAPGPANPLTSAWQWTPTAAGSHTLTLEAVDAAGRRNAAHTVVDVSPAADDADRDGVPDADDACPDRPGLANLRGCPAARPDTDGDGLPNADDACPDQAGPADAQGCPQPTPGDADGDGLPDEQDACPQAPGPAQGQGCPLAADADGDGVADWADPCPQEFGPQGGCPPAPDADGDGVPDEQDQCPDQPGPGDAQGCPVADADGDGLPDDQDQCPDQAGPVNTQGCPAAQADDADGDGLPDTEDACPDQPGPADAQGCPVADADGDGVPDDQDACPDQPGPADAQGCPQPDADGDGVPDDQDQCPNQPGPAGNHGCPQTDDDGDGIPNADDACPQLAGDPAYRGCPPWVMGLEDAARAVDEGQRLRVCTLAPWLCNLQSDADGDGVPDGEDRCPDQVGPALNSGCPWVMPGPGQVELGCPSLLPEFLCDAVQQNVQRDLWEQWRRRDWQQSPPPDWEFRMAQRPVEPPEQVRLQLENVTTNAAWVDLDCTVRVDDGSWRPLTLESADGTQWSLRASQASVDLTDPQPDGLDLRLVCWGWRDFSEGEVFLGRVRLAYSWTGFPAREFRLTSQDGEAGYNFRVAFTLCEDPAACP